MPKKKDGYFWESAKRNNHTYISYYNRLAELAISRFEWINLPLEIDARFLELTLFSDGMAVFFNDESIGFVAIQVMIGAPLDVYRNPMMRTAYASNGYNKQLNPQNSVLIYNNYLRTNSLLDIELYALRLYELERAIDVNIKGQKTPILITCSENKRLSLVNLYQKYDGNEPVIYITDELNPDAVKAIPTVAPYVADKLQVQKERIWGEAMSYLGIETAPKAKRHQMPEIEVAATFGDADSQRYIGLSVRQEACKKINEMFGLNLEVKFRESLLRESPWLSDERVKTEDESLEIPF